MKAVSCLKYIYNIIFSIWNAGAYWHQIKEDIFLTENIKDESYLM